MSQPETTNSNESIASLTVTGNSVFDTTTTNGDSSFNGLATFSDGISVTHNSETDNLTVSGNSVFGGIITNGDAVLNGLVYIGTSNTDEAIVTTLNVGSSVLYGGASIDTLSVAGNSTFANTTTNGTSTFNTIDVKSTSTFTGAATFNGEVTINELTVDSITVNSLTTNSLTIGSNINLPSEPIVRPNTDLTQIGSLITITNYIIGLVPYSAYGYANIYGLSTNYTEESVNAGAGIITTSPPNTTPMYSTLMPMMNYYSSSPSPFSTSDTFGYIIYNTAQLLTSVHFGGSAYPFGTYIFIATYAYIPEYPPVDTYGSYISTYLWSNLSSTNTNSFTAKNNYIAASNLINGVGNILTGTFYCVIPIYTEQTINMSVYNYLWTSEVSDGCGVYMLTGTLDLNTDFTTTTENLGIGAISGNGTSGEPYINGNGDLVSPWINSSQPTTLQVVRIA